MPRARYSRAVLNNEQKTADMRYSSFGLLGRDFFTGAGFTYYDATPGAAPISTQFQSPGAPFGPWVGIRVTWQKAASR